MVPLSTILYPPSDHLNRPEVRRPPSLSTLIETAKREGEKKGRSYEKREQLMVLNMVEMVINLFLLLILSPLIYSAPLNGEERDLEEKKSEMRDFIIFRFAMKSCEVPSECHDKILYALKERIPPNCDTAKSDLLNCLKKEIHFHRGSSDLPLDLDSICCSFPSSGPLCPEICKTSLRSISMTPLQIYNNIATHCSSLSFPGDSQISECIEVARHIHSRKEKECKKTRDFDD